jgi:hypothetical protein
MRINLGRIEDFVSKIFGKNQSDPDGKHLYLEISQGKVYLVLAPSAVVMISLFLAVALLGFTVLFGKIFVFKK